MKSWNYPYIDLLTCTDDGKGHWKSGFTLTLVIRIQKDIKQWAKPRAKTLKQYFSNSQP
eukprot:UN18901